MLKQSLDHDRLRAAYEQVRRDLIEQRRGADHWTGELASSALSTATAVSALSLVRRYAAPGRSTNPAALEQDRYESLIAAGLKWLAKAQNEDGGWGDTEKSRSNIATTMIVRAAFHLTAVPAKHADLLERAKAYCRRDGGVAAVRRRYGKDKTFAVPILANAALAGMVPWNAVAPLPFELSCLPQSTFRFLRLPVVSYALPALIAIGQARYVHRPPLNPLIRWLRAASVARSLAVLESIQPSSGGFLEATPLTSFVVMSLAGSGHADHAVVRRGVDFLLRSVRPDGSWPIDTNLATWVTSLSLGALTSDGRGEASAECLDWLLDCQYLTVHPFTGAAPGGWGWSDLSGAVPDGDDTPAALLALDALRASQDNATRRRIDHAAVAGIEWLLGLQNRDGGWPTFCRGWGKLPFDRSGTDLTAHVLRAFETWRSRLSPSSDKTIALRETGASALRLVGRMDRAAARGFAFLSKQQREDGSWLPLWFGNQSNPDDENPVYGTARVLLAFGEAASGQEKTAAARGVAWLLSHQNEDGGFGGEPAASGAWRSSVEETGVAVEALLAHETGPEVRAAVDRGLRWLVESVQSGRYREPSPIGFYFAKLWYYERLYPLIFCASALGRAVAERCDGPLPDGSSAPSTESYPPRVEIKG